MLRSARLCLRRGPRYACAQIVAEDLRGDERELLVAVGLDQPFVHRLDDLPDRKLDGRHVGSSINDRAIRATTRTLDHFDHIARREPPDSGSCDHQVVPGVIKSGACAVRATGEPRHYSLQVTCPYWATQ